MYKATITNSTQSGSEQIIVKLQGELDSSVATKFKEEMEPVMANANKEIILNLSELEYISSAGLRTLMVLAKNAAAKGGSATVVGIREEIREIFQITGFDKIFKI